MKIKNPPLKDGSKGNHVVPVIKEGGQRGASPPLKVRRICENLSICLI